MKYGIDFSETDFGSSVATVWPEDLRLVSGEIGYPEDDDLWDTEDVDFPPKEALPRGEADLSGYVLSTGVDTKGETPPSIPRSTLNSWLVLKRFFSAFGICLPSVSIFGLIETMSSGGFSFDWALPTLSWGAVFEGWLSGLPLLPGQLPKTTPPGFIPKVFPPN